MKKLLFSVTITTILGFFSALALILLYLALSDIADQSEDLTLEWYIAGVCMIILSAFTVSSFVTLGLLFRSNVLWLPKVEKNSATA